MLSNSASRTKSTGRCRWVSHSLRLFSSLQQVVLLASFLPFSLFTSQDKFSSLPASLASLFSSRPLEVRTCVYPLFLRIFLHLSSWLTNFIFFYFVSIAFVLFFVVSSRWFHPRFKTLKLRFTARVFAIRDFTQSFIQKQTKKKKKRKQKNQSTSDKAIE